ncbi:gamma-glutamyltransferase [Yanshouia hominis]|uniref:Glutathione hydrolase proenzyme n=1 Tax=Yanshouia hominis TaxID=2763673 RepID=A0ABR7NEV8_9FIRM|nr:gamma-glutamyltransferase [Yanshouia hominis]MBC8574937.1 gamma-glutamyltransferase [Yanshouia hominis]
MNRNQKSFIKRVCALMLSTTMCLTAFPLAVCAQEDGLSRDAYGYQGMVSAADPVAAQIGLDILKQGGNAADAAVATAFALGLVEPAASGIGGSGFMIYYDAAAKKSTVLNYYYECPRGLGLSDFFDVAKDKAEGKGGKQAVVPGMVAGMLKVNELFGSMSMGELTAPTIKMAEEGAEVSAFMEETYLDYYEKLLHYPETARIFTDDGFPYMEGDLFTNPEYADTLRIIAEQGFDGFYKGAVAEDIVRTIRDAGGCLSMQDLADYSVQIQEPYTSTYRGYTVATCPPSSGGAIVLEALNIAEHFPISTYEHNGLKYVHTWGEIFHVALADYRRSIDDPEYTDQARAKGLITKTYGNMRAKLVKPDSTWELGPVGDAYLYAPKDDPESHTTHLSVIDKAGNMVSMTNTHGDFFGTQATVYNRGFLIENTQAFTYNGHDYVPEAGKKGKSPMCPTLIFDPQGRPFAAIGTPGSNRIMATNALVISNMIDYGMDIQTALDQPRLFQARNGNLQLEGGISSDLTKDLEKLGHKVVWHPEYDSYFGGAHCVSYDAKTGQLHGAADPRRSGQALGY